MCLSVLKEGGVVIWSVRHTGGGMAFVPVSYIEGGVAFVLVSHTEERMTSGSVSCGKGGTVAVGAHARDGKIHRLASVHRIKSS